MNNAPGHEAHTQHFGFSHDSMPGLPRAAPPDEQQKDFEDNLEEGELSEGQFEDLYEPRPPTTSRNQEGDSPSRDQPVTDQSRGASVFDTPDAGFYGNEDERITDAVITSALAGECQYSYSRSSN
jgi:hypothetical protein